MPEETFPESRARWLVLAAFMVLVATTQVLWITFAPVTSVAARFYGVSELMIGLLSMVFMIVYIPVVLPSAWAIDTWGFRKAVGLGAILMAGFALLRGIFASSYPVVFASQVGIAAGQPLVIGAITKLAAGWFPERERATAAGLGTLALYLGPLAAMLLGPYLVVRLGLGGTLVAYGAGAAAAAAFFLLVVRESPAGAGGRTPVFEGLKSMLRRRDFLVLLVMFFVGLGMFNSISTWIEDIVRPRGFTIAQAGALGGLMLVGGIAGAIAVPLWSDRIRRRKPFLVAALAGLIPGLAGMTFARSYGLLLLSGFVFGFFLLSAGPIGFQYAAEITAPAPEGTSNSLLLVAGQISGIAFIFAMDALRAPGGGAMTASLLGLAGLTAVCVGLAATLRESPIADPPGTGLRAGSSTRT